MSLRSQLFVTAAAILLAVPAHAQTPPAPPPPPPITAGWNDGFLIQSADGNNRLQFGVTIQADGRFSLDDPSPFTDTFLMRKARPTLSGRVSRYFDFKLMPELAGGNAQLLDGYFDIRLSTAFRIRSGKDKTPVGYELLLGDSTLIFPERSVVSLLVPNRDVGFQVLGEVAAGKVLYSGGVFNGQPVDGSSSTTDADSNDGKDLAGRIVVMPFKSAKTPASLLNNFGFHLGASTGNQNGALPSFRTSAGQTIFTFVSTTADGRRNRITPAVFIYAKRFGAYAEYARSSQDVAHNAVKTTIANHAWEVTASYVLTGEAASDRGVRPNAAFDPQAGHWGAVQIAARYGEFTLDDAIFAGGLAGPDAVRTAHQAGATIDWYLTNYIKLYGAFERFTFNDGVRDAEHSIIFRTQLAF
jgi:phosphate-selective porin OprO/OprP